MKSIKNILLNIKTFIKVYFKLISVFTLLIILNNNFYCKQVDKTKVENMAQIFINSQFLGFSIDSIKELESSSYQKIGYVIQMKPEGYIVMSNDTDIYPIIVYSKRGQFDFRNTANNILLHLVQWDLEARKKSIELKYASLQGISTNNLCWQYYFPRGKTAMKSNQQDIYGPLLSTKWDQNGFYDDYCPYDPQKILGIINTRSLVGCTAVSAAQIINYWKFPQSIHFNQNSDHYISNGKNGIINIPEDASTYDFPTFAELNSQLSNIQFNGSQAEIAYLCFGVGIKLKMNYSWEGSGAYQSYSFFRNLGFGSAYQKLWSECYNQVINNIEEGWPVQVSVHNNALDNHHSVVFDGYNTSNNSFHVNMGWSGSNDDWYIPPELDTYYKFNSMGDVVYDICPYKGWCQWGADPQNSHRTPYSIPENVTDKWHVTCANNYSFAGLIVGEGGNIISTSVPNTQTGSKHPSIYFFRNDGVKLNEIILSNETEGLAYPAQSSTGKVYIASDLGNVYLVDQLNQTAYKIFSEPNSNQFNKPPKIDKDGNIYLCTFYDIYCLRPDGSLKWSKHYPGNSMDLNRIPAIDDSRGYVYTSYYDASNKISNLLCINKDNGNIIMTKVFNNVSNSLFRAKVPAIASDGTVYIGCTSKLYALNPNNNLTELWNYNSGYGPIDESPAIAKNGRIYFSCWESTASLVINAVNPSNGNVIWKLPVSTDQSHSVSEIYIDSIDNFCFTVNQSGNPDKWYLYCYKDNGNNYQLLWGKDLNYSGGLTAFGPDKTLYIIPATGYGHVITAISETPTDQPFPEYTDNNPPNAPIYTSPSDDSKDLETTLTFHWSGNDIDGQSLKYIFYIGLSTDMLGVYMSNLNTNSLMVSGLKSNTTYLWSISVSDGQSVTQGPTWLFTTKATTIPLSPPAATVATNVSSSSFTANWNGVNDATGYRLDVSSDNSFINFVSGYNNRDVGNVMNYNVTGLDPGTVYYYRLRTYNNSVISDNSNIISVTTTFGSLHVVWTDNFESYSTGSFPSAWIADANAKNEQTNYIDEFTSYEGSKSIRLTGSVAGCWAAIIYRSLAVLAPFEIELKVKNGNEVLSGCHPFRANIGLRKGASWANPSRTFLYFNNVGNIVTEDNIVLQPYNTLTWYDIRIRYEKISTNQVRVHYWINGTDKGTQNYSTIPEENELTYLDLDAQEGTVWYDNVTLRSINSTPVSEIKSDAPFNFFISQNYPNPFNPTTTIKFSVPASLNPSKGGTFVSLKVYDLLGREVTTLVDEEKAPGNYEVKFDATNLPSGIYFYSMQAGSYHAAKKLVVLK